MNYNHFTTEERACIAVYVEQGLKITQVAKLLNRDKSAISRELKRNRNKEGQYFAVGAQRKYNKRRKRCGRKAILTTKKSLYDAVYCGLEQYWSPEQIANTLPNDAKIGVSTIYRSIKNKLFPKEITKKLRRYGKHLKHKKTKGVCYDFSDVRTFGQRPTTVLDRREKGHWELDTVVLRQECGCHLATFVERTSRLLLIKRIDNKKAKTMSDVIIEALRPLPQTLKKTLTVDRGLEFTDWKRLECVLNVKVYFCDPYKPWQRGSNENTNGLIRQFFPRRTILPPVTDKLVKQVQDLINNRPRKCLNWSSPYQIFCCT